MRIMCIGDVVGSVGCRFLRDRLPSVKRFNGVDLVICNGENSADGNGMTAVSAHYLFDSGVDAITLGNHAFRRQEVYGMLDENPFIVRPANFPDRVPGKGIINLDMGRRIVTIINLMGNMGMDDGLENAFDCADRLLEQAESKIILLDFHAETTSEKRRSSCSTSTPRQPAKNVRWAIISTAESRRCLVRTPMSRPRTRRCCRTARVTSQTSV